MRTFVNGRNLCISGFVVGVLATAAVVISSRVRYTLFGTYQRRERPDGGFPVLNRGSWLLLVGPISQSSWRTEIGLCNALPTTDRLLLPLPLAL